MTKFLLFAVLAASLAGCAPIPPLQAGPYWFKSGVPSTLPAWPEYSYRPPADCPTTPGIAAAGWACGPAIREGKPVFLIWIDSSYSRADQNCFLNHELAHRAGYFHAQRHASNRAELCGDEVGNFLK